MSHMVFLNFSIESRSKKTRHMSHTVLLNFTKIQEHCISLKNCNMSHVTYGVLEF